MGYANFKLTSNRIDYHVSIHTRPASPGLPRPPVQNLSFSTYGPNNQDQVIQSWYRRTADDTYIQSLPDGQIMSFKTTLDTADPDIAPNARAVWGRSYASPMYVHCYGTNFLNTYSIHQSCSVRCRQNGFTHTSVCSATTSH